MLFFIGDWNVKLGNQEISKVTGEFGLRVQNGSRPQANKVLPRECTGHSKNLLPTTHEKTLHIEIT